MSLLEQPELDLMRLLKEKVEWVGHRGESGRIKGRGNKYNQHAPWEWGKKVPYDPSSQKAEGRGLLGVLSKPKL